MTSYSGATHARFDSYEDAVESWQMKCAAKELGRYHVCTPGARMPPPPSSPSRLSAAPLPNVSSPKTKCPPSRRPFPPPRDGVSYHVQIGPPPDARIFVPSTSTASTPSPSPTSSPSSPIPSPPPSPSVPATSKLYYGVTPRADNQATRIYRNP